MKLFMKQPVKTYGNPFETSLLIRLMRGNKQFQSFFIHELPPNGTIEHLRERVLEKNLVPFVSWELYVVKGRRKVVLDNDKVFSDYGIARWDSVYLRDELAPESFQRRSLACGRLGGIKKYLHLCKPVRNIPAVKQEESKPYGYLQGNSSNISIESLFSRESLDCNRKVYIL
ncbi:hypothetical protein LPJ78_002520 [Coemansia sp. RSA 989]|nr:hypothetical protein LPJ68_001861 [Coemansia sp. RSA 1086]KAJ1749802.1 hypothetical protein LPJ79_003429 [Coemansia sp. RSA 1821]KAJ1865666.1 hypothetical protein LPJ78_002520 [Coemansia sp. RSA 989]KAJ1871894.1 hypothetical protein LPJ55_003528 [Coemansia sp. RSA 990]KAJ2649588.1 hypothetical protein IWW40_003088 [Coemansia sp. RSA 1250]KAJ2669677.1 hypothetical protein IWW42_004445 [Coemansia sp. RSA 1085]